MAIDIKFFLKNIIRNNYNSDKNILLVTHQGVIDILIRLLSKGNSEFKENLKDVKYPKGALTKVFEDNEWKFKKINW